MPVNKSQVEFFLRRHLLELEEVAEVRKKQLAKLGEADDALVKERYEMLKEIAADEQVEVEAIRAAFDLVTAKMPEGEVAS
jgi:hypothetical protein